MVTFSQFMPCLSLCILFPLAGLVSAEVASDSKCPVTGKATNKAFQTVYEEQTYTFCSADCVTSFNTKLAESLYGKIGGKAAVDAAVDLFYKKIVADAEVNHFFEDINMKRQISKQTAFIAAALGGPKPWTGKDLRKAHASLDLTEKDFGIIAGHLKSTLEELKVDEALITQVMTIVGSTKDAVLNKEAASE